MKQKKKNKAFTFICSFLPGAAEMYMGFMKLGLSLMALFFFSFMIPAIFSANDVLLCVTGMLWFYSFFHARNMASLDDMEFMAFEDKFIWEEFTEGKPMKISGKTGRKWFAVLLIVFGCGVLWSSFRNIFFQFIPDELWEMLYPVINRIPEIIFAIIFIFIGIKMVLGKKEELNGEADKNA